MSNELTAEQVNEKAKEVANIIANLPTEARHVFYNTVAIHLRQRSQNFSASLFRTIAELDKNGI